MCLVAECKLDIALLVDCSGSIRDTNPANGPDNWGLVIQFMENIVRGLTIGVDATNVGAVTFGKLALSEKSSSLGWTS